MYHLKWTVALCLGLCAAPVRADAADPKDEATRSERPRFDAAASADQAFMLPTLVAPGSLEASPINVAAWGGYDSAHDAPLFRSFVDANVYGPLAIRAGVSYLPESPERSAQPHVGARLSLLREQGQGLDLALGAFYRMERFTEEEGLAQALISAGKHFGRTAVFANVVYGQDVEGDDREGELLCAVLQHWSAHLSLGVEARARWNLGSTDAKRAKQPLSSFDAHLTPTLSYALGPVALLAQAGPVVGRTNAWRPGLLALLGVGGAL